MSPKRNKRSWFCSQKRCSILANHATESKPNMTFTANLDRNFVEAGLGRQTVHCLVDSGAMISCISRNVLQNCLPNAKIFNSRLTSITGVCGETHPVLGETSISLRLGDLELRQNFTILGTLHAKVILGIDFLRSHKVQTDFGKMTLTIPIKPNTKVTNGFSQNPHVGSVTIPAFPDPNGSIVLATPTKEVIVPPHSEMVFSVRVPGIPDNSTVLLEPVLSLGKNVTLSGSKSVCTVNNGVGLYMVLNPTALPVFLKPSTKVAKAHLLTNATINSLDTSKSASVHNISADSSSSQHWKDIVLDLGINLENTSLSKEQKEKLYCFLGENRDVFAKDLSELGQSDLQSHTIITKDENPISSGPYRLNPTMRKHVDKALEEMLDYGIIEESNSPYHSPIVLVQKKGSPDYRFCVDFRALNRNTVPVSFPIPMVAEVFDTVADSQAEIFSCLDLRSGFWQVPLDPATKHKSAFITHRGVFQFNRLPFGLSNSPKSFQSLMAKVLKGMNFKAALVYIDDVLIFSKNFNQHLEHLEQLFSNLRQANLKLHPAKCTFASSSVKYLGHIISKDGVRVSPENTDKIRSFPEPTNAKQVKSFLGMANYYRRFIKDYAKIASPLNALLRKNQAFQWSNECQQAFDTLKIKLTTAPILAYPRFDMPFILTTDASDLSIAFMLSQNQDGKEFAIAYGGRSLRGTELKWHITDKEALALVEGVQTYKHYLASQHFTVFTDNVSVKYLQKIRDCNGRLGRWSLLLQAYDFEIKHKPGDKNPTDFLSRQIYDNSQPAVSTQLIDHVSMLDTAASQKQYSQITFVYDGEIEDTVVASLDEPVVPEPEIQRPDLANLQHQCPDFFDIYNYKLNNIVPDDPFSARTIVAEAYNYELEEGILNHFYSRRCKNVPKEERLVKQVAVPKVLRDDVLKSYHDCVAGGGHQGFERTYAALRNKYFWPSMYSDIKLYIQSCEVCQRSKRDFHARPPPLHPQPVEDVMSRWHMDILSGLPTTKDKYKHILLVVDSCSKWCEAFPLRTQEATEVASVLYKEIFTRFGAPRTLITDRAQNFTSKLIKALCELFSVTKHLTSSYHPQTNGAVERMNSVVLQALRVYTKNQQDDWPELLPGIMMAYRATPATQSTDMSPYFMLFGREMRLPIDTALVPKDHLSQGHKEFLTSMLHNLEKARQMAAKNIQDAQQKYKRQHDKRAQLPDFRPAQRVWLYCTKVPIGKAPKLHRKWVGPYYITQVGPNHTFKLRHCGTNKEVKSLVNARRLKPYFDPADRPTNPPPELEQNEEELDPQELNEQAEQNRANNQLQQPRPKPKNRSEKTQPVPKQQPGRPQQAEQNRANDQLQQPKPQPKNRLEKTQPVPKQKPSKPTQKPIKPVKVPGKQFLQPSQRNSKNEASKDNIIHSTKPSCQDCRRGNCRPFSENEIEAVISSARGNGTLYYKLKFVDKVNHPTDWYFPCKIPSKLIREFHANRNMQGKKRKRPLKANQHKFFEPNENSVETKSSNCNAITRIAVNNPATCNAITQTEKDKSTQTEEKLDICTSTSKIPVKQTTPNFRPLLKQIKLIGETIYYKLDDESEDWHTIHSVAAQVEDLIENLKKSQIRWIHESIARRKELERRASAEITSVPISEGYTCSGYINVASHPYDGTRSAYIQEVLFGKDESIHGLCVMEDPSRPPMWGPLFGMCTLPLTQLIEDLIADYDMFPLDY